MTFELGKQYIVEVTKNGIIPVEEFKREKFFDKDHDSLDFLTDEEKTVVINEVLDKIKTEMDKARFIDKDTRICKNTLASGLEAAMQIIDKYKAENKNLENEISESEIDK